MQAFLVVTTLLLLVATVLPMWREEHWMVRVCGFPRLQLCALLLINTIVIALFMLPGKHLAWALLCISVLCAGYQAWWILPFTKLYPTSVESAADHQGTGLRIMIANVKTPNDNHQSLLNLVRRYQPDLLLTLETNSRWQQHLDLLEQDYPFSVKCPLDNLYGMHVYSRLPLHNSQLKYLVEPDKPSVHTTIELPSGQKVEAHFLHPAPPSPTENSESTERDAELLVVARAIAEQSKGPVIVAGDLNDVAWSITTRMFKKISGLMDPIVGRGMFNSFHADYGWLRWPLDHLFHSHHFKVKSLQRLPHFGSDHFPILSELILTDPDDQQHQTLTANQEERQWAKQKHQQEDVSRDDVPRPE